jgi:hypothetical protein
MASLLALPGKFVGIFYTFYGGRRRGDDKVLDLPQQLWLTSALTNIESRPLVVH